MSPELTPEEIKHELKNVDYPGLNRDIVSFGFVKDVRYREGTVEVDFSPSTDRDDLIERMSGEIKEVLTELDQVKSVTVHLASPDDDADPSGSDAAPPAGDGEGKADSRVAAAAPGATTSPGSGPMDQEPIEGVEHIIAVASGKGGVGKSTVAVNLAAALSEKGHDVALADMDIYGPSAPTMFGIKQRPRISEDEKIQPLETHDIRVMSIGFVLDETEPVVWRGPMVMKAVEQFLRDVDWGQRDFMIIDLPPGTGDAQLTLMQKVPLSGAVIVTTPQDVALIDAQKGVEMFRKLDVKILGISENMSRYVCPECGHEERIFGSGGGRKEALRLDVPFLGGIPIDPQIRAGGDEGEPIVYRRPAAEATEVFFAMAETVAENSVPVREVMDRVAERGSGSE